MNAAPRKRARSAASGRSQALPPAQRRALAHNDSGSDEEEHRPTGEAGKRRARHEIWSLEEQLVARANEIAVLEHEQKVLQRRMQLLQASVRVRESQVNHFELHAGHSDCLADQGPRPELLHLVDSHSSLSALRRAQPKHAGDPSNRPSPDGAGSSGAISWLGSSCSLGLCEEASSSAPSAFTHRVQGESALVVNQTACQVISTYKKTCTELSQLLFVAEDASNGPEGVQARASLEHFVETRLRGVDSIGKVCNPVVLSAAAQPVMEGMEAAPPHHWEGVARAMLLSPQQTEDIAILDQLRTGWQARIQTEQAALHALLHKVLTEAEQQWKVHWAEGDVRKGELMLKLKKVVGSHRWLVVLVDELLISTLLTPIQVVRFLVHSYPWVPDAVALVQAVARQQPPKQALEAPALGRKSQ